MPDGDSARYFEKCPFRVEKKNVLELGAGCGLAGIATVILRANCVVMTDVAPVISNLKQNVQLHEEFFPGDARVFCRTCDWRVHPPPSWSDLLGVENVPLNVILVADCVWVEELVEPLLKMLRHFVDEEKDFEVVVYVSYQQRGRAAHERFWEGIEEFMTVRKIDLKGEAGLVVPQILSLFECYRRS